MGSPFALLQEKTGISPRCLTLTPYLWARRSSIDDARSASAAIVSDGFTHSEVGTLDASVTKMPGWPRSSWRSSSADVLGSSPIRHDASGCAHWILFVDAT